MVTARPPVDPVPPHARQRLVRILHEAKMGLIKSRGMPVAARSGFVAAPDAGSGAGAERPATGPSGAERPLVAETDILEALAADLPLPDVLHRIALAVDALLPDAACSILLLDPDGVHLRHGASPRLPDELNRALDGQPIGPQAGSCGTAAFTGEPVVVTDIATDPRWDDYRHLIAGLGFRACWSTPVLDTTGRVLATFALYERTQKAPDDDEIETIASFAHLVGIAIERDRQREALRASEERFRTIHRSVPVSIWEEDWSEIVATIERLRREGVADFRRHFAAHPEIVAAMLASMRVLDVNDQTLRIFGARDRAELERKLKAGRLSADVVGAFADQIATMAEGATTFEGERTFLHASGGSISTLMRIAYPPPDSESGLVLVSLMDVTALKRLESERASFAERLGTTLESMTDAFCLVGPDWRFIYLNAEAERVLKRRREELLGRSMWDEFPEARGSAINAMYLEAMRDGTPRHMEFFYPPLAEWLDIRAFPSVEGLAIYFRVITERKLLEARLAESEERFRIIARATADFVWDWDLRRQKVWWTDRLAGAASYLGTALEYRPDEWTEAIHPDDRDRVVAIVTGAIERREDRWVAEYRYTDDKGGWIDVEDHGQLIFDADGVPVRMVGGMSDISLRKRLEERLRENEERFRLIADTAADRFWDWNLSTGILWWAGRDGGNGEAQIGAAIGPDLGERIWGDRLHPEDRERVVESFVGAIERGDRKWVAQYRYRSGDESWIELEDRGQLLFDAAGKLLRFMGSMTDITEKKGLDAQLRESEERFRIIARTTADVVWDWDLVSGTTWRREGMYGRFGNSDGTSVSFEDWKARLHPDDRDRILAGLQETVDRGVGEWIDHYRVRDQRGQWIDIEDHGRIVLDESGKAVRFVGGMTDITARKRAERDLRERIKELNCLYRAVELTTGDDRPVEAICADIAAILPGSLLHDDVAVARITVDGSEQRSAGWQIPLVALQEPIRIDGRALGFVEIGYRESRPDEGDDEGPFLREERALVNAVATHIGRMIGDRRMAETLIQSEKLRSVGELTGGVAHDFNNLLTIILGNAEMLAERLDGNADLAPLARTTMAAAERGAELTSRLLSFARRQALEPAPTDINKLVAGMDGMLRRALGEQIEMVTMLGERLRPSLVDAPRLENVLLNLCSNARDAMAVGGRLTIETRNVDIDAEHASLHDDVTPGRYVMIAVSDTGTGMTPEVLARAFDPFFTTKEVGKGSGLGLSMVYGFVKQSRGHVSVYSEPGQGTTVRLYLPEAENEVAVAAASDTAGMPGGNEKVLLVEDDDLVREHVAAQLVELGYAVTAVANGRAALERLRGEDRFDLLFTDIVMPGGINGRQLADAAHEIHPGLPVLFTSGYTEDAIVHHGRLDPGVHLLSKPYRRYELATKLREALGR